MLPPALIASQMTLLFLHSPKQGSEREEDQAAEDAQADSTSAVPETYHHVSPLMSVYYYKR
jgi:hypothetical protein